MDKNGVLNYITRARTKYQNEKKFKKSHKMIKVLDNET